MHLPLGPAGLKPPRHRAEKWKSRRETARDDWILGLTLQVVCGKRLEIGRTPSANTGLPGLPMPHRDARNRRGGPHLPRPIPSALQRTCCWSAWKLKCPPWAPGEQPETTGESLASAHVHLLVPSGMSRELLGQEGSQHGHQHTPLLHILQQFICWVIDRETPAES